MNTTYSNTIDKFVQCTINIHAQTITHPYGWNRVVDWTESQIWKLVIESQLYSLSDVIKVVYAKGYVDVVRYLVEEQGADIHADNEYAMRCAAMNGHLEVVKYLVEEQRIDIRANHDHTMRLAAAMRQIAVMEYLCDQGADIRACNDEAIQFAAWKGDLTIIVSILQRCENPIKQNMIRMFDNSAVRQAAMNGHLDVVKYLCEQGVDIHAKNNLAVRYAAMNGHLEVVQYLVEQGADIDEAVRYAVEKGHLDVVQYLVEQGADIDEAVRYAVEKGHLDVVQYLVEQGAD
jgi:ankyrin repeat protein